MARLYGHKFTSNYGECDDGTWLMALQGLSQSDLSRGLSILMSIPNEWPPSVPKFKQLCLGIDADEINKRAKVLAIKKSGGEFNFRNFTVNQCRAAIRELLGEATKELMEENMEKSINGTLVDFYENKLLIGNDDSAGRIDRDIYISPIKPPRTEKTKAKSFISSIRSNFGKSAIMDEEYIKAQKDKNKEMRDIVDNIKIKRKS